MFVKIFWWNRWHKSNRDTRFVKPETPAGSMSSELSERSQERILMSPRDRFAQT